MFIGDPSDRPVGLVFVNASHYNALNSLGTLQSQEPNFPSSLRVSKRSATTTAEDVSSHPTSTLVAFDISGQSLPNASGFLVDELTVGMHVGIQMNHSVAFKNDHMSHTYKQQYFWGMSIYVDETKELLFNPKPWQLV